RPDRVGRAQPSPRDGEAQHYRDRAGDLERGSDLPPPETSGPWCPSFGDGWRKEGAHRRRHRARRCSTDHWMGGEDVSDDVGAAEASTYNRTEGVSGFDWEHPERVHVRRDVTISVRFSEGEIAR